MSLKPSNPKSNVGATKVPLHLVSGVVKAYLAVAFHLGWTKYGAWNYRVTGVSASTYKSALDRHMDRFWEGEWLDPVDGTPHLANALACIAILIEGFVLGNITDDRPPSMKQLPQVYAEIENIQAAITEKYKDSAPRHYTIKDTQKS